MEYSQNRDGPRRLPAWITGAESIAQAIGVNPRSIGSLVKKEGLPAFKYQRQWRILVEDIGPWSRSMAKKYRKAKRRRPIRTAN